ncbi:MAG: 50S ribosomal protein L25 [Patescibacteria group bacterium]|nr:50S ribosomal protein L25 [Patescibacteria group bacterium]
MAELQVKDREILGKKVKSLRAKDLVPAELFGHNVKNKHLSVLLKDFTKVYKEAGEHTVLTLITEKGEKLRVIISEVAKHPITQKFLSIDFRQVRKDEKIHAKVPIEFTSAAPAIKRGVILVKVLNEIEIEALPDKIPHSFEVNLSKLDDLGQSISIYDLKISSDIKVLIPPETIAVTVSEQTKEEVAPPPPPPTTPETAETAKTETEGTNKPEETQKPLRP